METDCQGEHRYFHKSETHTKVHDKGDLEDDIRTTGYDFRFKMHYDEDRISFPFLSPGKLGTTLYTVYYSVSFIKSVLSRL